jgi:hypothetical protein
MGYKFIRFYQLIGFFFFSYSLIIASDQKSNPDKISFEFFYETMNPVKLQSVTLYAKSSALSQKVDSVVIHFNTAYSDTFEILYPWKYPVNVWMTFTYEDNIRQSNKFFFDPNRKSWQIFVNDTSVLVKPQPKFSFSEKDSFIWIILILQGALELILALLFYKLFRWPAWILLVVIVANLCAFPIYMLNIKPLFVSEMLMLLIKFLVIFVMSRRKLGITRILILTLVLNFISFGFKIIMLFLTKLL